MKFKLITTNAPEYSAERLLRWEVLAKPHGMPPGSEAFAEEMQSMHLIAMEGKNLVGCICFHQEGANSGRIFEMAVSEEYQGQGFGRKLLHHLEELLLEKGISDVYLFVRPENQEFYTLMGYALEDEIISQMGLKSRRMKKTLHVQPGASTHVS